MAEETLRTFRIADGYLTEIIQDAAPGKDGAKLIDDFHPFNTKIPELIVSKTKPADHATLKAAGTDIDKEITAYGDPVPPMFWLRDPDGNSLIVVQPAG